MPPLGEQPRTEPDPRLHEGVDDGRVRDVAVLDAQVLVPEVVRHDELQADESASVSERDHTGGSQPRTRMCGCFAWVAPAAATRRASSASGVNMGGPAASERSRCRQSKIRGPFKDSLAHHAARSRGLDHGDDVLTVPYNVSRSPCGKLLKPSAQGTKVAPARSTRIECLKVSLCRATMRSQA